MSLGERVSDIFHSPETEAASRGEVDRHTPGAFPVDDMNPHTGPASTGRERNKLHKPNDPRGHGYSDSGVGIDSNEPAVTNEPVEDAYAPAEGEGQEERAKKSSAVAGENDKHESNTAPGYDEQPQALGTTAGTTVIPGEGQEHNLVRGGKQSSSVEHADPYWGDLPENQQAKQGQGVYNTVAGHGSDEKTASLPRSTEAQDSITSTGTDSRSTATHGGVYNTVTGHGSNESDAKKTRSTEGQGIYNTVTGHGSNEDRSGTSNTSDQRSFPLVGGTSTGRTREEDTTTAGDSPKAGETKDSHWKEGAAGAAVTGAAGAAAYKATRDDEKDKTSSDKHEGDEKKKSGGLFGFLHRGSSQDDDQHKKEKKHTKDERFDPVAAGTMRSGDKDHRRDVQHEDQNRGQATDPAAAAAAAAAFSKYGHDGTGAKDNTASSRDIGPASHGNAGDYNVLSSGTTSGVRTENTGPSTTRESVLPIRQNDQTNVQRQAGDYKELSSGTPSGVRTDDVGASTTRDSSFTPGQSEQSHSGRDNALYGTAAAAAGTGAAGYGIHELRKDRDEKAGVGGHDTRTTDTSYGQSASTAPVLSTAAAHTAAPTTAPIATEHSSASPTSTSGSHGFRQPSAELPRLTEDANHGKYNVLSSGTPSGIAVENNATNRSSNTATSSTLPPAISSETSNKGAMATAGIAAAGTGAGAAALATRDDDKNLTDKSATSAEKDCTVPLIPGSTGGGQQQVLHKCVKCGEQNDISQYFTNEGRLGQK